MDSNPDGAACMQITAPLHSLDNLRTISREAAKSKQWILRKIQAAIQFPRSHLPKLEGSSLSYLAHCNVQLRGDRGRVGCHMDFEFLDQSDG